MAETIVNLVLNKLADVVVKEALFMYGVHDKAEQVQRELTWIRYFLKDADKKRHKNEKVQCWMHEVKEVGYLIEDTLDECLIDVGGGSTLKRIGKLPMRLIAKHNIVTQIDKIQQRTTEILANTIKYGIECLKDDSTVASVNLPVNSLMIPDLDKTEVVGFEVNMRPIFDQLFGTNRTKRAVISIVGAGGSGTTTLAKEVFKSAEVKSHFEIRLWLTISKGYNLKDNLIKMLEDMGQDDSETRYTREDNLITKVYNCMKKKKYLVVLDDVWSYNTWKEIKAALPKSTNSSRVLITTRFMEIAEKADARSKPYEIKPLGYKESQQLLLKKIFPNRYANECPDDLLPLVPLFTKKCGGWPLALVVLGALLSKKLPNYNTWDGLMRNIDWKSDRSKCIGLISASYDDLSIHLKTCFMYFAAFPDGYQIKATSLVRLWVAEGIIGHDASKTMEDIAESYLVELVQRCFVQVASRSIRDKIKFCHLHDVLREVAIQKAKEDNFLMVFSNNDTQLGGSSCARRVTLHNCSDDETPLEQAHTNLRSLFCFGYYRITNWKIYRMLRVLNIPHEPSEIGSNWLNALTALRYIEIQKYTNLDVPSYFSSIFKPAHLIHIKNLQTVKISFFKDCGKLPKSFWENKLLRHVVFSNYLNSGPVGIKGPPSAADLPNLLTLKWVTARKEWVKKPPRFPRLSNLGSVIPYNVDPESIVHSLSNLHDLSSLSLINYNTHKLLLFPCGAIDFRNHQNLFSLYLDLGIWQKQEAVNSGSMVPFHLIKLTLEKYFFDEDPMRQLEKMPNLRVLKLGGAISNLTMVCSRRGFSCLQRLVLSLYHVDEWKIEEGAMPLLNQLQVVKCFRLNKVPDFQYLTNLQDLLVCSREDELTRKLQQRDHKWKIKHIPIVRFT